MKICSNCGSQMPDEVFSCTVCGSPLAASQVSQQPYQQPYQQPVYQQPYQQPVYQQPYPQIGIPVPGNGKATASLILGILGILFPTLILSVIGIVLGVQARNIMPEGTPGRGKATAGLICSVIGCVWSGIVLISCTCLNILAFSEYL